MSSPYENRSLIWLANQWTGFHKEVTLNLNGSININLKKNFNDDSSKTTKYCNNKNDNKNFDDNKNGMMIIIIVMIRME